MVVKRSPQEIMGVGLGIAGVLLIIISTLALSLSGTLGYGGYGGEEIVLEFSQISLVIFVIVIAIGALLSVAGQYLSVSGKR
jgi:hypothetical protein